MRTFVVVMSSNHGEDFAQYPDLQTFKPYRTGKNGDGYDIYGCGGAVREGEPFRGIAEVHAVSSTKTGFLRDGRFAILQKEPVRSFQTRNGNPTVLSSGTDQWKKFHMPIECVVPD